MHAPLPSPITAPVSFSAHEMVSLAMHPQASPSGSLAVLPSPTEAGLVTSVTKHPGSARGHHAHKEKAVAAATPTAAAATAAAADDNARYKTRRGLDHKFIRSGRQVAPAPASAAAPPSLAAEATSFGDLEMNVEMDEDMAQLMVRHFFYFMLFYFVLSLCGHLESKPGL